MSCCTNALLLKRNYFLFSWRKFYCFLKVFIPLFFIIEEWQKSAVERKTIGVLCEEKTQTRSAITDQTIYGNKLTLHITLNIRLSTRLEASYWGVALLLQEQGQISKLKRKWSHLSAGENLLKAVHALVKTSYSGCEICYYESK